MKRSSCDAYDTMSGKLVRALMISSFTSIPPPPNSLVAKLSEKITFASNLTQSQYQSQLKIKTGTRRGRGIGIGTEKKQFLNNKMIQVATCWQQWYYQAVSKHSSDNVRVHAPVRENLSPAAIIQEMCDVIIILRNVLFGGVFAFLGLIFFYFSGIMKKNVPSYLVRNSAATPIWSIGFSNNKDENNIIEDDSSCHIENDCDGHGDCDQSQSRARFALQE